MLSGLAGVRAAAARAALGRGTFFGCRAARTTELALVRRARACVCVWGEGGMPGVDIADRYGVESCGVRLELFRFVQYIVFTCCVCVTVSV